MGPMKGGPRRERDAGAADEPVTTRNQKRSDQNRIDEDANDEGDAKLAQGRQGAEEK
jgi:hypothetical protein